MANWLVKRRKGAAASGLLTLVTSEQVGFVIPAGTAFTAHGHTFKTKGTIQVRTHAEKLAANDRQLVRQGKGVWTCTIPVTSENPGANSNLRKGTQLRWQTQQLPFVRKVYAAKDFGGGADEESNAQMFNRMARNVGGKVWSNRMTCEALVCDCPKYGRLAGLSIVGFGDPEMLRDRHSLWPGSTGGRSDVYVKPHTGILTKEIKRPGVWLDREQNGTLWEIKIDKDAAPGFLYVASVSIAGSPCQIVTDRRGHEACGTSPDIKDPLEATYSAFQTAALVVRAPNWTIGHDFVVNLRYLEGIADAQERLSARGASSPAGDVLVKAAVPCITTARIDIQRHPRDPQVQEAAIREAVSVAVNNTGFVGRLSAAHVMKVVSEHLDGAMAIKDISLGGKIRCPDGNIHMMPAGNLLTIPNDPARLVTPRTTVFFLDPADVEVHVTTVDAPDIYLVQ
jgi:hypothetical protein